MNDNVPKKDFVKLEKNLDKRFDDLTALMSNFANQTFDRFDAVDKKFDSIDKKFDSIDMKFDYIDKRFDYVDKRLADLDKRLEGAESRFDERFNLLTNIIDGYAGKIDMYAQEMAAMSHKINRLERYIQVLADKAGVDLDKIHA
jgi:flagellar capping protein FliD